MGTVANIPWLKIISLGVVLVQEVRKAIKDDGRIDVAEALSIIKAICANADIAFDDAGAGIVLKAITLIIEAITDKTLTATKLIAIAAQVCKDAGVTLDMTGVTVTV